MIVGHLGQVLRRVCLQGFEEQPIAGDLAENLTVGVTYTYEWSGALWDIWGLSEDESVRHEFAPDDVIHLGYRPIDADRPGGGRKHSMYINDGSAAQDVDAAQMPDFWAVASDVATAVENETWGHIKNRMNQRLQ